MQAIAQAVSEPVVFGLSRVNLKDVRRVLAAGRGVCQEARHQCFYSDF